ncbi:Sulfotransferase family protein [Celeribacter baekdonensis]|jgi:hypothetical protein|uniref:Sulfotransferase family protein n=1 Tax=Celeribacter baekdonensis TaxID=875171 RepID=A0A1G7QCD5_9RHOB|nr:sulfotransferase [Celeribacter baekdonensis]SDF96182.1 Sulfotransferase family protein [Celeribacter baekdonensis]
MNPAPLGPNTFLIGAPKCGTTAIARYIAAHPDGFIATIKEPSFWSSDFNKASTMFELNDLDDYLALYNDTEAKVILDASTGYIASEVAIEAILAFAPAAKFIVILRNPIDLAPAYHMEKVFNCYEDVADFEQAWNLQAARARGESIPPLCPEPKELQYKTMASVGSQLARVQALIPDGQLIVLFHEDLVKQPREVWLALQDFLELDDDGRTDFPSFGSAHFNRFPRLARLYQNPPKAIIPLVRFLKRRVQSSAANGGIGARIKSLLLSGKKRQSLRPEFRQDLVQIFASEITKIEDSTGRNLDHWRK